MLIKSLLLIVLIGSLCLITLAENTESRLKFRQRFQKEDFKFDLARITPVIGPGGNAKVVNIDSFPALLGEGLSFALVNLEPCTVNLPHIHPRASELIYLINGNFLRTGFVEENGGRTIINDISTGQVSSW